MDTESRRALELLADRFDVSEAGLTVVFSSDELTAEEPAYREEMEVVLAPLRRRAEVVDIATFYDGGTASMVSADGGTAYAVVSLEGTVDQAIRSFQEIEESLGSGALDVWTTGGVPIFADINDVSERDLRRGEMIAIPLVLVALVFVFRGVVAASIPVTMGAVSVAASLAILYFVAQGMDVSIFALNLASFLGLGVAVDYSLLVVSRYREEMGTGSREEAIGRTMASAGKVIVFSGVTSVLGLSSLLVFDFMMLRSLGVSGVLVISVSLLVALTLVPAVLAVTGDKVNALSIPGRNRGPKGYWGSLARVVMRRPVLVAVPLICLLILLGTPFLGVKLGSPWASVLPEDAPSRQGWDVVSEEIGPGELTPVVIAARFFDGPVTPQDAERLKGMVKGLERHPTVERVESLFSLEETQAVGASSEENVADYVSQDTAVVRVYSRYSPVEDRSRELVKQVRGEELGSGVELLVTGATADLMDSVDAMYADFPKAVAFVVVTVYVVLLILFRSVLLPLKAVLMNMMSIFASYGALVFIFQQGHLEWLLGFTSQGVTEASVPILLFAIIFGLSMDYEIFLLSRIREEYQKTGQNALSVARGLEATGPIITNAAMILVLVAAAFASGDIIIVKALGVGTAIAVFLDATVVRALLVPSLMRIMDRWNWWSPRVLDKLLPRI